MSSDLRNLVNLAVDYPLGWIWPITHDLFQGSTIGYYITLQGKEGVVLQQTNSRVVHVYNRKYLDKKRYVGETFTPMTDLVALACRYPLGHSLEVVHDGFHGSVIGYYITRESKPGLVLQQDGTLVVHVYSTRWFD